MNKDEREAYNRDRKITCRNLMITETQYNWFRRMGNKLHKLYEEQCNGYQDAFGNWDEEATNKSEKIEEKINQDVENKAKDLGLYVFFQTDPRGATIYLDRKPIPENNYTSAHVIY